MSVTLRIHHGDVDPSDVKGRLVRVDGVTVGALTGEDAPLDVDIERGTHCVWLHLGPYDSNGTRISVRDGETVELVIQDAHPGPWGFFAGGFYSLTPLEPESRLEP